jgi:hypothetical protein
MLIYTYSVYTLTVDDRIYIQRIMKERKEQYGKSM